MFCLDEALALDASCYSPRRVVGASMKTVTYLTRRSALKKGAMAFVGGGILVHGIPPIHHWVEELGHGGGVVATLGTMLANAFVGVVAGALVLGAVTLGSRLKGGTKAAH